MKKIFLVLGLALFLGTAVSTATEIQQVNAATTEFAINADDAVVNFNDDEPKVAKTEKKDAKAGCASAASCDKTKCASKTDASAKAGCCDKSKTSAEASTKAGCCSKDKAVKDTDKK